VIEKIHAKDKTGNDVWEYKAPFPTPENKEAKPCGANVNCSVCKKRDSHFIVEKKRDLRVALRLSGASVQGPRTARVSLVSFPEQGRPRRAIPQPKGGSSDNLLPEVVSEYLDVPLVVGAKDESPVSTVMFDGAGGAGLVNHISEHIELKLYSYKLEFDDDGTTLLTPPFRVMAKLESRRTGRAVRPGGPVSPVPEALGLSPLAPSLEVSVMGQSSASSDTDHLQARVHQLEASLLLRDQTIGKQGETIGKQGEMIELLFRRVEALEGLVMNNAGVNGIADSLSSTNIGQVQPMRQPSAIGILELEALLVESNGGDRTIDQNRDNTAPNSPKDESDDEDHERTRPGGGGRHAEEDRDATTRTVYRHRT